MERIPEHEYIETQGCRVVTFQLIELHHNPSEVKAFSAWFTGQTGIVMENGTLGIYIHDYERWLEEGRLYRQLPHSWD